MANEVNLKGILDAALKIAAKRREILTRLRAALESGRNQEALALARQLCGLDSVDSTLRM
jgi:hypothetical protein